MKTGIPKTFSPGDMRHRIEIQKRLTDGSWAALFLAVPAALAPSVTGKYPNLFTIWERGEITNQHRVVKGDETFGIARVIPYDGQTRVTQLYCSESSKEYTESVQLFNRTLGARDAHGHPSETWAAGDTFYGKLFLDGVNEESDRPSETSAETVQMLLRYPTVTVGQQAEWNDTRYRVSSTQYRVWDTLVSLRPVKEAS